MKEQFAKQIKQSNIVLGTDNGKKFSYETTNTKDYDKKGLTRDTALANEATKLDLRKAHFAFGSSDNQYQTTNKEKF